MDNSKFAQNFYDKNTSVKNKILNHLIKNI